MNFKRAFAANLAAIACHAILYRLFTNAVRGQTGRNHAALFRRLLSTSRPQRRPWADRATCDAYYEEPAISKPLLNAARCPGSDWDLARKSEGEEQPARESWKTEWALESLWLAIPGRPGGRSGWALWRKTLEEMDWQGDGPSAEPAHLRDL